MAAWASVAVAAACALAGGGYWLYAGRDAGHGIEIVIPTPAPVIVHISGAVKNPGVYELPTGARLQNLLDAAGGAFTDANLDSLNLARPLADGERVDVPSRGAGVAATGAGSAAPTDGGGGTSSTVLDLNTATQSQLETLPNIGPARAQLIIDYRQQSGPIERVDDLLAISGIGPATVDSIRDLVVQP